LTTSRFVAALIVLGAISIHTQESSASAPDSTHALYGTTTLGGAYGYGVVYKVDQAGNQTVLYSFKGAPDGAYPACVLTSDSAGNLYGTTAEGGTRNVGTVFKIDPSGNETVLRNFGSPAGTFPRAGLIRDGVGNLYGITEAGGAFSQGVVFKMNPMGYETILHSFTGGSDGIFPEARLIRDSLGNLYGTTINGGPHVLGTVYKVDPAGNETVLYAFTGGADGGLPIASVTRDSDGNLYGTTSSGGQYNFGAVYKVDASGNETVLYSFSSFGDGARPNAGVVRDAAGNLYGATGGGGPSDTGVVYKLDPSGNETILHTFTGGADGGVPSGDLVRDSAGILYGTTAYGGLSGNGVVYRIDPAGQEHVVYSFTGGADGSFPRGVIMR
jgi:uncharacterized repeat protein (TIGR03803 family)